MSIMKPKEILNTTLDTVEDTDIVWFSSLKILRALDPFCRGKALDIHPLLSPVKGRRVFRSTTLDVHPLLFFWFVQEAGC